MQFLLGGDRDRRGPVAVAVDADAAREPEVPREQSAQDQSAVLAEEQLETDRQPSCLFEPEAPGYLSLSVPSAPSGRSVRN